MSSSKTVSPFSIPLDYLEVGKELEGFKVVDVIPLPEYEGMAYVMRHMASGARAMWLACDDQEKSFAIAFKTPPANDKGVFHIIEHSVLCGSDRFPVKEPFVNLLKTSMQTFLNALTFSDKTMYPVASTNTADLENLMDVYLDAVLHPAIYHRPRIFEQEGWHHELTEDGELKYNGVVFNEMKGAMSDPDDVLFLGLDRALFPDTAYRFESGGDPRAIPQLSYEEFIDAHARHYDLANSYVILYGDMDIARELAFVGERLCGAAKRDVGVPNPLCMQEPVKTELMQVKMATAPENASVALAYVLGSAKDRRKVLACDIMLDSLAGSNESPLKRAVLDADLGDDFSVSLIDGTLQPRIVFQLKGAKPGVAEQFRELVESTCARLAREGIGHDRLAASIARGEFNLRELDYGSYPTGVALSIIAMSSWLYDDDRPVDYLRYEDDFAAIKDGLDKGYFEDLLRSVVCQSEHCAAVELIPTEDGAASDEAAELAELRAQMSEADLARIDAEVAALREEQERPDSPEDLATLPQLSVADVGPAPKEIEAFELDSPIRCIAHELPTRGICYLYWYFNLRHVAYNDLPYVTILCDLLGKLDTKSHTAAELDTLTELNLGDLGFTVETLGAFEDPLFALPQLVVTASALCDKVEYLARIPQEIWEQTIFEDTDRMLDRLTQRRIAMEQGFTNSGHVSALSRLTSQYSMASKVGGVMAGVDYYLFLKELLANWETRAKDLPQELRRVAAQIFCASNAVVSFVGKPEDRERFWNEGQDFGLAPEPAIDTTLDLPELVVRNEAFVIPSNVSYVCAGVAPSPSDTGKLGTWSVAQRTLSYDYLWNEVRVKGGAYGTGFRRATIGLRQFWSYRDPNIDATLKRYDATAAWLKEWEATQEEMDGYVVSTVSTHDSPTKPQRLARRQDTLKFSKYPDDYRQRVRAEILGTTADDIRALVSAFDGFDAQRSVCVFGPREAIEASTVHFDEIVDLMG